MPAWVITFLLLIAPGFAANSADPLYFFRAEGCPHCAEAEPVLGQIAADHGLELRRLDVTANRDYARQYIALAARFGFKARSVPGIFLGRRYWVGYTAEMGAEIRRYAEHCARRGCGDAMAYQRPAKAKKPVQPKESAATPIAEETPQLDVPFVGKLNLARQSLWANTALIAFVDGFNPCSLWVLTMLLALIIHTGSRGKIFLVGFTFLTVTSAVYVAFIAGLFSVLQLVGFVSYLRVLMAIITLAMGVINIKDFFWFGKGISLTIAQEKKPGILARMRQVILSADAIFPMLAATVLLAAGVSLTEFSCTAGFPVLWVNLVSAQQVQSLEFSLLLALYMLIYQLDEIVIFLVVVFTMRIGRFQESHGRLLKLIGGVLMVTLAAVLVLAPQLLENPASSLWVFAGAFAATGLVYAADRILRQVFKASCNTNDRGE